MLKLMLILFVCLRVSIAFADEGMWLFNKLPYDRLKEKHGFQPTADWIDHVMKSSVRFNSGGSGSFVSSNGLVITNHHVGADTLHKISDLNHNYYEEGFYAKSPKDEVKALDLELNQLVSIEDVTSRVRAAVNPKMTAAQAAQAKQKIISEIQNESLKKTGLRSDVVTLYNGGAYHLYRYKRFTDVRLVFAPEFKMAFFGGDPDNFEYPRYDLDICVFRVWENGQPAKIENFFKWSDKGAAENDLVFVSGNPGTTNRQFTMDALRLIRDTRLPLSLSVLFRREVMLQQYMNRGELQKMQAKDRLFYVQNARKANLGYLRGLQDRAVFEAKEKAEKDLRASVAQRPELARYKSSWDKVARAEQVYKGIMKRRLLLDMLSSDRHMRLLGQAYGFNSTLFDIARLIVRVTAEDLKPDSQRLAEYLKSNRESLEQTLYSRAPIYPELEEAQLVDSLSYLMETLGGDDPLVKKVMMGKRVEERAHELVSQTKLGDPEVRKQLVAGGADAVTTSKDPMIALAKLVDPDARQVRRTFQNEVEEIEDQAYADITKARFALNGENDYPDATFTPRLAFGVVKGYEENGRLIPATTTMGGAFDHEKEHQAQEPWRLPESWHKRSSDINHSTPFNFVSTADIIGGNSGSPVLNRSGEFAGIIFDGNIQSLVLDFIFTDDQARAVSVQSSSIKEAMNHIYGSSELAAQLGH